MTSLIKRSISSFMAGLIAFQPLLAQAGDISNVRPDTGPRPHVDQSYNGKDVLNIARPNGSGVSHDVYNRFSAGDLILNNSPVNSKTLLGGWVEGNPNFQRGDAAKLWVGEVIGGSASQLSGILEVSGSKLDIVLANEYGITCNGCGFINTDRVTLSTGVPRFSNSGAFEGLDVRQGTVTIGAGDLNPETRVSFDKTSRVDVIARAAAVYGKLRAKNLNIVAGTNAVDYNWSYDAATGQVSGVRPIEGRGSAPALAVDVSALGGMYANAIQMIATENGVGVRLDGTRASGSDIVLDASGRLHVAGQGIQVRQKVIARAKGPILLEGSIISENDDLVRIESKDTLTIKNQVGGGAIILEGAGDTFIGAVVKGRESLAARSLSGKLTAASGASLSASTIELSGNSATIHGSAQAGETLRITASGEATTTDGATLGGKTITIKGGTVQTAGRIDAENRLTIHSRADALNTGNLSAPDISITSETDFTNRGAIEGPGSIAIQGGTVLNTNLVNAKGGNLTIGSGSAATNTGTLSGIDVTITSGADLDNRGTIVARDFATLKGLTVRSEKSIDAGGKLTIGSVNDTLNSGKLSALDVSIFTGTDFTNRGTIEAKNAIVIDSDAVLNTSRIDSDGKLTMLSRNVTTNDGELFAADMSLLAKTDFINNGKIDAEGAITMAGRTFLNASRIDAKGTLTINAESVATNSGMLSALGVSITAGTDLNNRGTIIADEVVSLKGGVVNSQSRIDAKGILTIDAGQEAFNTGELTASGVSIVSGTDFTNRGTIVSRDFVRIDVETLHNSGTISGATLATDARGDIDNSGLLTADGALKLTATGAFTTAAGSTISGQGVDLSGSRIDHAGTVVARAQAAFNAGPGGLDNRGVIRAQSALLQSAVAITNRATISTDGKATIKAGPRFDALAGSVLRGGSIAISADTISTAATIAGVDRVDIVAGVGGFDQRGTLSGAVVAINASGTIANSGIVSAGTLLTAETQAAITNAAVLISGRDMRLFARQIFNNGGVIWANNSITLAANANLGRAALVRNENGRIEAFQGDLVIRGDEVQNLGKAPSLSTSQIIKWTEKGQSAKINPIEQIVKLIEPDFLGSDGMVLPQYADAYAALWTDVVKGGRALSAKSQSILKESVTTNSGESLADDFMTLWSGMFARANAAGTPDPAAAMRALVNPAIFDANGVVLPAHASAYAALWETLASGGNTVSDAVKAILRPSSLVLLEERTNPVTLVVTRIYSNTLVKGPADMWAAMVTDTGASYDIVKILHQDRFANDGLAAELKAGGDVDIEAGKIDNIFGTVSAGEDIRVVANDVRNEAMGASQFLVEVHKRPSCFTCHSGKTDFYDTFGGRIEAKGKVSIQGNLQNLTQKSSELSTTEVLQKLNDYIAQKRAEGDPDLAGVAPATRKNFELHEGRKDDYTAPVQGDGNEIRKVSGVDTGSGTTVETGTDPIISPIATVEIGEITKTTRTTRAARIFSTPQVAEALKPLVPASATLYPTATVDMLLSAGLDTLAETNPEYTEYSNFITSNYMMKQGRLAYRDDIVNNTQETIRTALSKAKERAAANPDTSWLDRSFRVPAPDGSGMRTVYPASEPLTLNPGGALIRGEEVTVAGGGINTSGRIEGLRGVSLSANTIEAKGGAITAADGKVSLTSGGSTLIDQTLIDARSVDIVAGRDFVGKAISISARDNASILAAAGISITSLEQRLSGQRGNAAYTTVSHSTSSLKAGGDLSIVSLGDLTLAGVEAKAGSRLNLTAIGDVTLAPVENSLELKDHARKSRLDIYELNSVVTRLAGGSDVSITAGGSATLIGTDIDSGGKVRIAAEKDVVFAAAQDLYSYERESKSGNWWRKKQTRESETRVTNAGTDITASGNIEVVSASGNLVTAGSRFASAQGDVALKAVKGDIFAGTYTDIFRKTHESRKSFLGGLISSNSRSLTENRFATGTAALAGLDLTLVSGGDTALVGTQLKAGGRLSVETGGDFSVTAAISSMRKEYFSHRVGAVTMTTITENSFKEMATAATLLAGGGISFDIAGKASLTLYDYAGVDSKELRTLYPEELLKIAGLELLRKPLANEYFYDKKVALSPAFKALAALIVSTFVAPGIVGAIAPNLSGAMLTAAEGFTSSFLVGSLDGAVSGKLDIGAILKDAAFAGVTAGLTEAINLKIPEGSLLNKSLLGGFGNGKMTLGNILDGAIDGVIKSGLSSAFYGTDFGTGFTKELLNAVVSLAMADVQGAIGDLGLRLGFEDGSLPSMLLHGAVGCAAASATGDACAAGAAGAMAQSLYAGYVKAQSTAPEPIEYATRQAYQKAYNVWNQNQAKHVALVGAAAGYIFSEGKGSNVSAAAAIARSGFENNYLTHEQITSFSTALKACENDAVCKRKVTEEYLTKSWENDDALRACKTEACLKEHFDKTEKAKELIQKLLNPYTTATPEDVAMLYVLQSGTWLSGSFNEARQWQAYREEGLENCNGNNACAETFADQRFESWKATQEFKSIIAGAILSKLAIRPKPGQPATNGSSAAAKGGTFTGNINNLTEAERSFVERELTAGRNIEAVVTGAGRTPDFSINGVRTELKTISGVTNTTSDGISSAMSNRIMNGRGQASNVVVDMTGQAGVTREIAERGIRRAYGADNRTGGTIDSIRVVGPDFDITVPRAVQ